MTSCDFWVGYIQDYFSSCGSQQDNKEELSQKFPL